MSIDWSPFLDILREHQRFVISSHIRPDADALGSELSLAIALTQLGKSVQIINPGATPKHLSFLDTHNEIVTIQDLPNREESLKNCEVHIIVDTSAWGQLAGLAEFMKRSPSRRVVIDHHAIGDELSATEFKDTNSPASGCLIYELFQFLELPIDQRVAELLYAAIATDTGWFRFPATTSDTMRIIASLMSFGAVPSALYERLYEQSTIERIKLTAIALDRIQTACQNKLAYTYVKQSDFASTKSHPADTENLVNECMRIAGVKASFIAVEQPGRKIKISFRAREGVDVAEIAQQFGGGGHRLASGATTAGPMDEALKKIIQAFEDSLK